MLMDCWSSVNWGVNGVSIKYQLRVDWGYWSTLALRFLYYTWSWISPLQSSMSSAGLLYIYTCDWNYRPDHCMYGNICGPAKDNGISVIHGNRGVYHNNKEPFFKAIYKTISNFKPGDDKTLLARSLEENLQAVSDTYCLSMTASVLKYPKLFSV